MSSETKPLPELHQSTLDSETVSTLFRDLEACAEIFAVIPKVAPGHITPSNITLQEGEALLNAGDLRGLQIRYRFNDAEWWDTLICVNNEIRITRIQQDFGA